MAKAFIQESTLTDIADSIRAKLGVQTAYLPSEMAAAIDSIPTGGGTAPVEKAVNFIDYDGTLLHSYTVAEALALDSLPVLPTHHDNLTPDGWNWTLAQVKAYVSDYGEARLYIGANYHTTDGKTHILFTVHESNPTRTLTISPSAANAVTIDWGDGTSETLASAGQQTVTHTYTVSGTHIDAEITIACDTGTYAFPTSMGTGDPEGFNIAHVYFSNRVTSLSGCFTSAYSLQSVSIPTSVTDFGNYCFSQCLSLRSAVIPPTVASLGDECFESCSAMQSVSLPPSVTSFGDYCFGYCSSLQQMSVPASVTSLGNSCFYNCASLLSSSLPPSVTSIGDDCYYSCRSLQSVYMHSTAPPALGGRGVFTKSHETLIIYVPTGSLNDYQNAANWSTFASAIEEKTYV